MSKDRKTWLNGLKRILDDGMREECAQLLLSEQNTGILDIPQNDPDLQVAKRRLELAKKLHKAGEKSD